MASENSTATAYTEDQYSTNYPDGIGRYWWNVARNQVVHGLIRSARLELAPWIEVGCGRGVVVDYLREHRMDCSGVELAEAIPLPSVAKYVKTGCDANDLPVAQRDNYEGMLLLDVVEHLPDPVGFLRDLLGSYKNVKRVIVTVPARKEIWSNYDTHYGHYRRYSTQSLTNELSKAGLAVEKVGYFFHAPYCFALTLAKLRIERATVVQAPSNKIQTVMHSIVGTSMALESKILPKHLRGSSAFAICSLPER